jgi:hypothetical protein
MDSLTSGGVHPPSVHLLTFFQSRHDYWPAEGHVEAKHRQRPGPPPPATLNRLLAEPSGAPWVNRAWVEVSRGRFVGGCQVTYRIQNSNYQAPDLKNVFLYYSYILKKIVGWAITLLEYWYWIGKLGKLSDSGLTTQTIRLSHIRFIKKILVTQLYIICTTNPLVPVLY